MKDVWTSILPILGVLVGAFLTYALSRKKDREGQFSELRHEVYADYLKAVAAMATDRTPDSLKSLIDAKARLAIYGSNAVVEKLAAFEVAGASLVDVNSQSAWLELAEQMRFETGSVEKLKSGTLASVLFGKTPS